MKRYDMTGRKYGHLTAIKPTGERSGANNRIWELLCDCGKICTIDGYDIRSGKRTTCQSCSRARVTAASYKHGLSDTAEFGIWTDIQTRCYNKNCRAYRDYGGRGIQVCERWVMSFKAFLEDMGPRPKRTEIERINNDGDYEPGNCKWATRSEQAVNKRNTLRITIHGITKPAVEWARKNRLKPATIYQRFHKGWTGDKLLSPPRRWL